MFLLGLTGSIGMGKSTTAKMFADAGCDVWDADEAVHRMYAKGGAAVELIRNIFPNAIVDGGVSRAELKSIISDRPDALREIEKVVHPLVAEDRAKFIAAATAEIVVLDIPLLFEMGGDAEMDAVVCVSIPPELQKSRVMERGTMTSDQFEAIQAKQMPNDEKCAKSDYVIVTDTVENARRHVQDVIANIRGKLNHA